MDYKTIPFEVLETTNPYGWKWIVFLDATRTRTGIGLTRADAVLGRICPRPGAGKPAMPQAKAGAPMNVK